VKKAPLVVAIAGALLLGAVALHEITRRDPEPPTPPGGGGAPVYITPKPTPAAPVTPPPAEQTAAATQQARIESLIQTLRVAALRGDTGTRTAAADGLCALGEPARRMLRTRIEREQNLTVRDAMEEALRRMNP
jgi:hypothetical protein